MTSEASRRYIFGEFELFPRQGLLRRTGVVVPLAPKSIATLLALVERAGETVSKDDLLARVWYGVVVEENNLTQCISALRKIFGEKRGENRFIATESGTGYRFVASVTTIEDPVSLSDHGRRSVANATWMGRLLDKFAAAIRLAPRRL